MPELPDVEIYCECLSAKFAGQKLGALRIKSPFLLRSVAPSPQALCDKTLISVRRLGKRLVFQFSEHHYAVLHLMIAGRLVLRRPAASIVGKIGLAAFDFPDASIQLTEASTRRRASLYLVVGAQALSAFDRGGLEPLECTVSEFVRRLKSENRTLKRALVDPRLFSGIGNAYSDEILHRAQLSPVTRTASLGSDAAERLCRATKAVLTEWTQRLRGQLVGDFPARVTAFRPEMSVHGRFGKPCPVCQASVQRIRYCTNEVNYCATCQTAGRLLADRSLSRLLKSDWPRSPDELEEMKRISAKSSG